MSRIRVAFFPQRLEPHLRLFHRGQRALDVLAQPLREGVERDGRHGHRAEHLRDEEFHEVVLAVAVILVRARVSPPVPPPRRVAL